MTSTHSLNVNDDLTAYWLKEFASQARQWRFPELAPRRDFDYFRTMQASRKLFSRELFLRLQSAIDKELRNFKSLQLILTDAHELVADAVEKSEADAHAAWDKHEVWLSVINENICAADEPAAMLVESIDLIGGSANYSKKNLCATLGLWCYGEYQFACEHDHKSDALRLLEQIAIALAEAEFCRGQAVKAAQDRRKVSERHKVAAIAGHARNRQKKLAAFEIWTSRDWRKQSDAEREIAKQSSIIQAVAGRWIREFKHSSDAYRALQSEHSAMQRP